MIEKDFNSRSEVINWIIDTQLNRRNILPNIRSYLMGKRYKEEKKEHGGDRKSEEVQVENEENLEVNHSPTIKENEKSSGNSYHMKTENKIAEQVNVSPKTVRNAEKFTEAVDTIAKTTGINPQKILSSDAKATQNSIHQQTSIFTWHFVLKIVIDRHIDKIQVDPLLCMETQKES